MAINLTFSKGDILATTLIDRKQWLPLQVEKIEHKVNKAGDAMNVVVHNKVLAGDYEGMIITQFFSEKFQGGIIPFLKGAFGVEVKEGQSVDVSKAEGMKYRGLCGVGVDKDGTKRNTVFEYRKFDEVPATEETK